MLQVEEYGYTKYVKTSKGFTLVELLIVIAILGVLGAVLITILNPGTQFKRARDAQRRSDLSQIQRALELYYQDNGKYPETTGWINSTAGEFWIPGLDANYIKKMPADPLNSCSTGVPTSDTCYAYIYFSDPNLCSIAGRDYVLTARLEAYTGSDLSQKNLYNPNGSFCSTFASSPNPGLMVLTAP